MSRIGKKPVALPAGVQVTKSKETLQVKGPKGTSSMKISDRFNVIIDPKTVTIERPDDSKQNKALHGLYRALFQNMVTGNTVGFSKKLQLHGVGYRGKVEGRTLVLTLGYSHPVKFEIPAGIDVRVDEKATPVAVEVMGNDKQAVGQFASNIRAARPVEPYQGKGVRYEGETVQLKAGKQSGKK